MRRRSLSDSARIERALHASNRGGAPARRSPRLATFIAALALMAATIAAGVYRPSELSPPLGRLLEPAHGIWTAARAERLVANQVFSIAGLSDDVTVVYDARGVPHIRAANQMDLYRAFGYVVARDRLFQLEVQTRAATGTLSELVGAAAVPVDREPRQMGMPRAAELAFARLDSATTSGRILAAFSGGINAYIDQLQPRHYPVEFTLLDARPTRWQPINSLHLLARMSRTLAFSSNELTNLRARAKVGSAAADAVYPVFHPIQEPLQPMARNAPRIDTRRIAPPGAPDSQAITIAALQTFERRTAREVEHEASEVTSGSNNWAVAPNRAANGRALLAGDQHLDLTLPSIWYEVHLMVPDTLDVYGVSIPGAPSVVIGFNRAIAWTFTNTDADVTDYYLETVDDSTSPARYMLDGTWREIEQREEKYLDRDGRPLALDTVRYTHRGPLRKTEAGWVSMRWTIQQGGRELEALLSVQQASDVSDWLRRAEPYAVPAQNMLLADTAGNIAIRSTGYFPIRGDSGRGDLLRDGSASANDWAGFWRVAEYPAAENPPQGYLASANQQPIDPYANPRYLGAAWEPPWRAMRINELLRERRQFSADDMRRFQTNARSERAELFVPAFLSAAHIAADSSAARGAALLAEWNLEYTVDDQRAILFEYAMMSLARILWDELRADTSAGSFPLPSSSIAAVLLRDPQNAWWDDAGTPGRENRDMILSRALGEGYDALVAAHGGPAAGGWRWDRVRPARLEHLLGIAQFSAHDIPVRGGPSTLAAFSSAGDHGPSWRMVVELAPRVRGWGIYPGGQSGNPFSLRYRDRIGKWSAGELDELLFPNDLSELAPSAMATLTLRGVQ